MRILVIGDVPSKALWDFYDETKLKGIDLILSSGDLPAEYLSFLVTFADCPLLYVHGNHDDRYNTKPPDGCVCIDDKVYEFQGIRILGLGGSMRYRDGEWMFTEKQMGRRVRRMFLRGQLLKGFDILLTHSPASGIGDCEDLPHRGFAVFLKLMEHYHPRYMVHGHVHMNYGYQIQRQTQYLDTTIVNSYEKYFLEIEPGPKKKTGSKSRAR